MTIKKIFIFLIVIIGILFCCTSCSSDDVKIVYDLDTHVVSIDVPVEALNDNYKVIVEKTNHTIVELYDNRAQVKINAGNIKMAEYEEQIKTIKNEIKLLIPGFSTYIDNLEIKVNKEFFGSSLSGTTYYQYTVATLNPAKINVEFTSSVPFMFDGLASEKHDDKYTLLYNLETNSVPKSYDLEYTIFNVNYAKITFDISSPTPQMLYTVQHASPDTTVLRYELESLGMNVEFIDSQQVIFYEKYETVDDFNALISARLYGMFGIVATVDYQHGSFFTSDGNFSLKVHSVHPAIDIDFIFQSQDKTSFLFQIDGQKQEVTHSKMDVDAIEGLEVTAQYSNVRWFQSITSMLVIIAMAVVIMLMIFLAKKK